MKRSLRVAVVLAAVTTLLSGVALSSAGAEGATDVWPTYGDTYVLNASGGVTGSDGMRITYGGTQLQVQRRDSSGDRGWMGNGELYGPKRAPGEGDSYGMFNQIALAVGDSTNGGTAFLGPASISRTKGAQLISMVPWNVVTTTSANTITSTLTGEADALTYTVVVTITYTSPADRMKLEYEVLIPEGNTKPVRLYHLIDTFLGGDDNGPGFFTDPVDCGSGESGAIVGVDRADLGIIQAFQFVGGTPWTSYMSGFYNDVVFGSNYTTGEEFGSGDHFGPGFMNDLNNQIITDPNNDNGIGINWNFGSSAGSYSSVAKLIFSSDTVEPCNDPDAISPTNPDPTEVPDPIIDPVAPDVEFDPLKDPEPIVEIVAPSFTG